MSIITAKSVNKYYGTLQALKNVNLEVDKEIFCIIGPNGAGKSTLIKAFTGQTKATGSISVLGIDPIKNPIKVREKVGIVPERESVPSYLTVIEYLEFVSKLRKNPNGDRIKTLLEQFDLGTYKNNLCRELSRGITQRVMIASALIHEPEVLFLDEPMMGLDPIQQRNFLEFLHNYKENRTIFIATHILEIASKICDRVAIIYHGEIKKVTKNNGNLESLFLEVVNK
jgi:ABC-2 type transport system ATP-binding protein